jgi:Leucine-rich repeat (LRR) protein
MRQVHCLLLALLSAACLWPFSAVAGEGKDEHTMTQPQAIALIEKLGGTVKIDQKNPDKPVVAVNLHGKKMTDEDLAACRGFSHLKDLDVMNTHITDKALLLMAIRDKTELETLGLEFTNVTDASLKELEGAPNLKALYLGGVTGITDAGLVYLSKCPNLDRLVMWGISNITNVGLKHISVLTKMKRLNLRGAQITDDGLKELQGMTDLRVLFLWDTAITDAGLEHLKVFKKLETLILNNTKTTDAGIAELKKAIPKLDVTK